MREIKFRAWDKDEKKIIYDVQKCEGSWECEACFESYIDNEYYELMQYTELKDKKRTKEYPDGQEIYEGDIVRDKHTIYKVVFRYAQFDVRRISGAYQSPYLYARAVNSDLEIIGNIYENPELLKTK